MLQSAYEIFLKYYPQILKGAGTTLLLSVVGTAIGLLIGLACGIIRTVPDSKNKLGLALQKLVKFIVAAYVEVFRGTPMIVQAMVIYWGYAFAHNGSTLPLLPSGILIISINTGAYIAEIVRGGIISIDKGQYEGATSLGMTHGQAMTKVVFPQVLRNIIPSVSNELINNIKDTSVLNVISVTELFYISTVIRKTSFLIFETYIVICIVYFILTFVMSRLLLWVEKKLDGPENYTVFNSQSMSHFEVKKGDR